METTTTATSKEQSDAQAMTLPAATSEVSGGALSPSLLLPGLPAPGTGVEMTACSSSIVPQKNPRPTSPPPTPPPPAVHETALLSNSMYTTLGATARISSVAAGTLQHQSMFCHHHRCSGLAVFTYEGDARAIYCCDHMPISPEDAHNQVCTRVTIVYERKRQPRMHEESVVLRVRQATTVIKMLLLCLWSLRSIGLLCNLESARARRLDQ